MKYSRLTTKAHFFGLTLADGSIWDIVAANDRAYYVVSALAKVMQLQSPENRTKKKSHYNSFRRLIVHVESGRRDLAQNSSSIHLTFKQKDTIVCTLISRENNEMPLLPLMQLSMVICRDAQYRGGVLLHGAFAGCNGNGVLLAGPGGRGKTTASKRLPPHWKSLCDDTTLVICDSKGTYWAHPWPTWSQFMFGRAGSTWDVQHALPLKGIFFMEQAHKNEFESLGIAQSICLLNESAEQSQWLVSSYSEKNELRGLRLLRFENICALAQTVPAYVLRLDREGHFWEEIERALDG